MLTLTISKLDVATIVFHLDKNYIYHQLNVSKLRCIPINNYWIWLSHDIKNYPDKGQCYLPQPLTSADNVDQGLDNS